MKTIIINQDGSCVEFSAKKGKAPDRLLSLNPNTQIVVLCNGDPVKVQIISYESCDAGNRIATNGKVLFLRGNVLLAEYLADENLAAIEARHILRDFFECEGDIEIHKPVC